MAPQTNTTISRKYFFKTMGFEDVKIEDFLARQSGQARVSGEGGDAYFRV
jgi:hypothetical protein